MNFSNSCNIQYKKSKIDLNTKEAFDRYSSAEYLKCDKEQKIFMMFRRVKRYIDSLSKSCVKDPL